MFTASRGSKITYIPKRRLLEINAESIKSKRNHNLHQHLLEKLPDLNFPVVFSMLHNDHEMRVFLMVGPDELRLQRVILDMSFEDFNSLPSMEVPSA